MAESVVYGLHAVLAVLSNPHRNVLRLIIQENREDERLLEITKLAKGKNIRIESLSSSVMKTRFPDAVHQGVIAYVTSMPSYTESDLPMLLDSMPSSSIILVLDGVTDPHNLGACLRTSDAASVHFVMIPKDKSAKMTAVVSKVACGGAEIVPLVSVTNLVRALEVLKKAGVWVYGLSAEAPQSIYEGDLKGQIAFVLGSEGKGLRRLTEEACDGLFSLPMYGSVSSLNVSVTTGIVLYEALRQRLPSLRTK